ncbi:MAG: phosphoribosylformylglycinamidine synthase II, partial [Methanosarcinales archaeon]|nr:phosphoribosylformylglycinamidine synthase II [Methanosarcinales archaeon]
DMGLALSCGCNPPHSLASPYDGGACAVLENAMNIAVAGGRPLALVNCLNFGNPERPDIYWQFKQSILGIGDMARTLSVPVVGGNVSLYNESDEFNTAIPPTPSLGMMGIVDDVTTTATIGDTFTKEGASIILVGTTKDETGASEYADIEGFNGIPPTVPDNADQIIDSVIKAVTSGHVLAAHDISNGGLAVAVCEMAKDMGATINLDLTASSLNAGAQMFSESAGRALLVSDEPDKVAELLGDVPHTMIGRTGGDSVVFKTDGKDGNNDVDVTLAEINESRSSLTKLMME